MSQKNKIVESLSLATTFAPAHSLLPRSCSWLPLWILSPAGHRHAPANLLLNRRLLFYSSLLPAHSKPFRGAHGHAPTGPCVLFCPFITVREMSGVLSSLSQSFFSLVEHGHKFWNLCLNHQWASMILLNSSLFIFWKDSLSTLLTIHRTNEQSNEEELNREQVTLVCCGSAGIQLRPNQSFKIRPTKLQGARALCSVHTLMCFWKSDSKLHLNLCLSEFSPWAKSLNSQSPLTSAGLWKMPVSPPPFP